MKKITISLAISALLLNFYGCYSMQEITIGELKASEKKPEIRVITNEEFVYNFNERSYYLLNDSIEGIGSRKTSLILKNQNNKYNDIKYFDGKIDLNDISSLKANQFNLPLTIFAAAVPLVSLYFGMKSLKDLGD
jgi:hypothetical protein